MSVTVTCYIQTALCNCDDPGRSCNQRHLGPVSLAIEEGQLTVPVSALSQASSILFIESLFNLLHKSLSIDIFTITKVICLQVEPINAGEFG